jgi:HEAT repeat protein
MGLRKTHTPDALREVIDREHARDLDGLLDQLRSGDVDQRRWAARDLARHPQATAALGAQLLRATEASVREALLTSLQAMPGDSAVSALLPLLRSEDAQLRNGAIEALAGMPLAVAPQVAALLQDSDADVRILTVNLLGDLRHAQVLTWLLQVLHDEPEVNVVAAAIEVLAEVGQPCHTGALRAARERFADDAFIAVAADMAIKRIDAP